MDPQTVISKIGNGVIRETARKLRLPVMTVHSWKTSGRVPHWREEHIRKVAEELGVSLQ
jgi:hypothetical protein